MTANGKKVNIMNALSAKDFSERMPTPIERSSADQLRKIVAGAIEEGGAGDVRFTLARGPRKAARGRGTAQVTLAPAVAATLLDVLRLIAGGKGFTLVPVGAVLTTQEAADLLNVSRPFLVKLLEEGAIPHEKIGRHRRIRAEDLFAYKAERDRTRSEALSEMARVDAEQGLP